MNKHYYFKEILSPTFLKHVTMFRVPVYLILELFLVIFYCLYQYIFDFFWGGLLPDSNLNNPGSSLPA